MNETAAEIARLVRERARHRCEISRMHSVLQGAEFHIDHVIPKSKGGTDDSDNLSLMCPTCNLSKSDRMSLIDPDTGVLIPIFNPRRDAWPAHFRFEGFVLAGLTPTGRAMVAGLDLNSPRRVYIRTVEGKIGLHPPDEND